MEYTFPIYDYKFPVPVQKESINLACNTETTMEDTQFCTVRRQTS